MKKTIPLAFLAATPAALAHPGHGKPGFDHEHTLTDLGVVLFFALVLALAGWALLRILGKGPDDSRRD